MKCIYVCSRPELAKQLCIAVLGEGNAPFSPHLAGFALPEKASFAWLGQASEIWVYAKNLEECSESMRLEISQVGKFNIPPKIVWTPECFKDVKTPVGESIAVTEYGPTP